MPGVGPFLQSLRMLGALLGDGIVNGGICIVIGRTGENDIRCVAWPASHRDLGLVCSGGTEDCERQKSIQCQTV